MADVIVFANNKGGTAKSTSCANIAAGLAKAGKRVLMIDADSQGSLSASVGFFTEDILDRDISVVIEHIISRKPVKVEDYILSIDDFECLHLLPATIDLSAMELRLVAVPAKEKIIERIIKAIAIDYDYILIDCPPNLFTMTTAALTVADKVIIPCKPDYLAYRGLVSLVEVIKDVKELLNSNIETAGVIITMIMNNNDDRMMIDKITNEYNVLAHIKYSVEVKRAVYTALPVVGSSSSKNRLKQEVSDQYQGVCDMIINGEI